MLIPRAAPQFLDRHAPSTVTVREPLAVRDLTERVYRAGRNPRPWVGPGRVANEVVQRVNLSIVETLDRERFGRRVQRIIRIELFRPGDA